MRQILLILSLYFFATGLCPAQLLFRLSPQRIEEWSLEFSDDFKGITLDRSKWNDSYPWGRTLYCNRELQYYEPFDSMGAEPGVLQLTLEKERQKVRAIPYENDQYNLQCGNESLGSNLRDFDYSSRMIFSKEKFGYGYYEIRFQCNEGAGLWPAFWLYAGVENYEIDIFEIKGSDNTRFHADVHCPADCDKVKRFIGRKGFGGYIASNSNWNNGYNRIAIDWNEAGIKWFLNGIPAAYWKGRIETPGWIIANLALASDASPFGPGPNESTQFPAKLSVDYIRYWKKKTNQEPGLLHAPPAREADKPAIPLPAEGNAEPGKSPKLIAPRKELSKESCSIQIDRNRYDELNIVVSGNKIPSDLSLRIGSGEEKTRTWLLKKGSQTISLGDWPAGLLRAKIQAGSREADFNIEVQ